MRLYRLLLYLYPASFRLEYEKEMRAIWGQRRREVSGAAGLVALWLATLFEIGANALAVHCDMLRQDLRYTLRALWRSPGFTLTAVAVVALGVGANTGAFSVTDFVLIRPLPFFEPDRLVKLWQRQPGYSQMEPSPANYRDWKRMSQSFESTGAYTFQSMNLVGEGDPERIDGTAVTADLFPLLRAQPLMGRLFTAADDGPGAPGTVLLSYGLWQSVFAGDRGVIGRHVDLDNESYTVVGVMPAGFHFPRRTAGFWVPLRLAEQNYQDRNDNFLEVVARLKNGVSIEQAQAEMNVVAARLQKQYPKEDKKVAIAVIRLRDELSKQSRLLLMALSGAAFCVLLIACANLANLLLARAVSRRKELAVRAAIGAGRERLIRQMVTESMVLAIAGGAAGVAVAFGAVPLLTRLVPNVLPVAQTPAVDFRVLAFAAILSCLTGVAFGVFPALRAARYDLSALREGMRSGGGRKERLRAALVVAEVTASVVLLVAAGLLMRAMWRVEAADPGFRPAGLLTLRTALPMPRYGVTARRAQFYDRVLSDVRALPGVAGAAYSTSLPMVWGGGIWPVGISGELQDRTASHTASMRFITPGFFATLGIPIHQGRDISVSDATRAPFAAVVSDSFVKRYWPHENPLGRHFDFAFHDRVVVGIVGDVKVRGLELVSEPQVYLPYQQVPDNYFDFYDPKDLVIRSAGDPMALLPAVRQIIHRADPQQPISDVRTMDEIVSEVTASRRAQVRILGAFALIAFLLAGVGIHGLLSFAVSRRTQELGVRIALGARPGGIVRMILNEGIRLAMAGVLAGVVLAYAAARAIQALLAGVQPADALTFVTAIGLCILMTLLGSFLPALRAVRIDPIAAIRSE